MLTAPVAESAPATKTTRPFRADLPTRTPPVNRVAAVDHIRAPSGSRDEAAAEGSEEKDDKRFPVLPEALERDLATVFKLLSDGTRLRILLYLAREGELHVSALCQRLGQSQPAVSHHLALLRNAEIIEPRRDGKHNFYSIRQQRFAGLLAEFFATVRDPETDAVEFDAFTLSKG